MYLPSVCIFCFLTISYGDFGQVYLNRQGCGLGLDVSVSRRSRDLSKVSSRSHLGHVGKRLGLVSVSGAKVSVLASVSTVLVSRASPCKSYFFGLEV